MKITSWLLGVTLMSGIVVGLSIFSNSFFQAYDVPGTVNLSSISRTNEINAFVNQTQGKITSQADLLTIVFTPIALLWQVLIQILSLPLLFIGILFDMNLALQSWGGIPFWVISTISAIIVIVIVFKVVEIISGRQVEI